MFITLTKEAFHGKAYRSGQKNKTAHKPPQKNSGTRILTVFAVILAVMIAGVGCGFLTATLNTKQDLEDVRPAASSHIMILMATSWLMFMLNRIECQ